MPRTVLKSFLFFVFQFLDKHRAGGFGSCGTHSQKFSCDSERTSDSKETTSRIPTLLLIRDSDPVLFATASWSTSRWLPNRNLPSLTSTETYANSRKLVEPFQHVRCITSNINGSCRTPTRKRMTFNEDSRNGFCLAEAARDDVLLRM